MIPESLRELVNRSVLDRLTAYISLLDKWRKVTNLIGDESFLHIWERHILDGVHLQRQQADAKVWLDFGSGAGLPAAILAIILADVPEAQVHCVEIDRRKCSFLRAVAGDLSIPMKVHNLLAEDAVSAGIQNVQIVTARAFSSLNHILKVADPFLQKGAVAILPRGKQGIEEVARLDGERYSVGVEPNPAAGGGMFVRIALRASQSECEKIGSI